MNKRLHIFSIAFMTIIQTSQAQPPTELFSWKIAGKLPSDQAKSVSPGVAGPVTGHHHGLVMIGGGANFPDSMPWEGGQKKYHQQLFVFRSKGKRLLPLRGLYQLPEPIAYVATCTTPSGIFYAGGENEKGISEKTFLLKWDKRKQDVTIIQLPDLPSGLVNAACAADGNQVFIAGGETREAVSAKCWRIDIGEASPTWKELPPLPVPVSHAVLVAIQKGESSQLYLLGGRRKMPDGISEFYSSVYHLEPGHQEWSPMPPLPYPLSAGTGLAAGENGIYLFGGDRGTVFSKVENYLVAIRKEQRIKEKEELVEHKNQLLRTHPGFSKEIICYNTNTGSATITGELPYPTPVTTMAFWFAGAVIIPSGEIRAGVRSPNILMTPIIFRKE